MFQVGARAMFSLSIGSPTQNYGCLLTGARMCSPGTYSTHCRTSHSPPAHTYRAKGKPCVSILRNKCTCDQPSFCHWEKHCHLDKLSIFHCCHLTVQRLLWKRPPCLLNSSIGPQAAPHNTSSILVGHIIWNNAGWLGNSSSSSFFPPSRHQTNPPYESLQAFR